ncbi:MAG: M28 family peptidase [Planctomycetes bacterium]|nr:M28 family peptidase [Planctomycetota bacterium]
MLAAMPTRPLPTRPVFSAALALSVLAAACAQSKVPTSASTSEASPAAAIAVSDPPIAPPAQGKVIEGRVDPYSYQPKDDGSQVDLRKLFEGLGPVATEWYQHVLTLSNPFFEGRLPASRGSIIAGEYIEFYFKQSGLEPAFPAPVETKGLDPTIVAASSEGALQPPSSPSPHPEWTNWRQPFDVAGGGAKVLSASASWNAAGQPAQQLKARSGFSALGNSGSGKVTAPLAFAGYAIDEGRDGYSSFGEQVEDFTGRVVLFFRYEPLDEDGRSRWADRRFSPYAAVAPKMEAIIARKPAAIVMVNPPGARDGRRQLENSESSRFGARLDVPVIQISTEEAEKIVQAADPQGRSLLDLRKLCDEGSLKPMMLRDEVTLTVETQMSDGVIHTDNIGGVLRGKGALADQWVIVGAHYDHVGFGDYGADPSNRGKLHPGADDNASGTAAMLCTVKALADRYRAESAPADLRSVLFMAFSAEEVGLDGSAHWTRNPTLSNEQVQAMINLDMVGRMRGDELAVGGTGSAKDFMAFLNPVFTESGLTIRADPSGRGPSDHASFYRAGIPVLFLFTGTHDDYHKPSDRGFTVNPAGAARVVALTEALTMGLATRSEKLEFQSTDNAATSGRRSGARVRLGVMPGYGDAGVEGVRVDGVSAETAAADAGIQEGDVLVGWNGTQLNSPADMMERLREHSPGDEVTITLKRGDAKLEVKVALRAAKSE